MTYKMNKFKLPFAPFMGVNHHRPTILFGVALLEDEMKATIYMVFQQISQVHMKYDIQNYYY